MIVASLLAKFIPTHLQQYYLPHLRAYELLIGALFSFLPVKQGNGKTTYALLIAMLVCLAIPKDYLIGDGYIEQIAISLITALLILFPYNSTKNILVHKWSVRIGLLSYSLYLWHWVILAFFRYYQSHSILSLELTCLALFIAAVGAIISYYVIEQPIRRIKNLSTKQFLMILGVYVALFIPTITLLNHTRNMPTSVDFSPYVVKNNQCYGDKAFCQIGDSEQPIHILAMGDSHMLHYVEFVDYVGKKEKWSADFYAVGGCQFIYNDFSHRNEDCNEFRRYGSKNLDKYDTILLAGRWESLLGSENGEKALRDTLDYILSKNKTLYVFRDNPRSPYSGMKMHHLILRGFSIDLDELLRSQKERVAEYEAGDKKFMEIIKDYPQIHLVDLNAYIPKNFFFNGIPLYQDLDHLNSFGSYHLAEEFVKEQKLIK